MKQLLSSGFICCLLFVATAAYGQRDDDVLATSNGFTYKASSLSPEAQRLYTEQRKILADTRTRLLSEMIAESLLELEAQARRISIEQVLDQEKAKVPQPSAAEIQKVYAANTSALGGRSLEEVRPQIVEFLIRNAEEKLIENFVETLKTKHKLAAGKDIKTIGLGPQDILFTVGSRSVTLQHFEDANRVKLNDVEMHVFEDIKADLEAAIFSSLVAQEAKARNVDESTFRATEITDKLRSFTNEERAGIEAELMQRLFTKYNVKILMRSPQPIVHHVSSDDDPFTGNAAAPVTVVMFTDFQCPACARTHPVLKQAVQAFGDKVRLVIRDFPLESIHKDAFNAALAANAANRQGKFTEYTDILYRNQDALDGSSLRRFAGELGLNVKQFELDFTDAKNAAEIRKDQSDGNSHGIAGTPAIFVNGVKVHRLSLIAFRSAIENALKK